MIFYIIFICFVVFVDSSITLYPNFNTIGITVVDSGSSCATVQYCQVSPEICASSSSLVKAPQRTNTHYGSLFNLKSNTQYRVSVTCGGNDYETTTTTKADYTIPGSFSQTLYVSPSGSGSSCSSGTPCSISEAVSQLSSGTKVVVTSGTYNVGGLSIYTSGTSSEPIVFQGESGAIFDGSSDTLTMSVQGSGVYTTDISSYPQPFKQVVMIKKSDSSIQRLMWYNTDESDFNSLIYDTLGYWISGNTLKVNIGPSLNVNDYDFKISVEQTCFTIGANWIWFNNLEFKHYGSGSYPKALYYDTASYGYVSDCVFNHNDMSIGLKRQTDDFLIEDNEFFDSKYQFSWQGVKSNDQDQEMGAITTYSSGSLGARGMVVRNNEFHDYFDGFGVCQEDPAGTMSSEIDIHDNYIYNIGDDALECDGVGANVRIYNNRIENVLVGISLAPTVIGPAYVINNRIENTGRGYRSGDEYYGMGFKVNVNSGYTSGTLLIYHNFVKTNNVGSSAHVIYQGKWENLVLRNNILMGDSYAMEVGYTGMPMDYDYDGLYCGTEDELVYWTGVEDGHFFPISEVRSELSQEMNGVELSTDDIFEGGDPFVLKPGSGLVGNGVYIPGINRDGEVNIGLLRDCDYYVFGEDGCGECSVTCYHGGSCSGSVCSCLSEYDDDLYCRCSDGFCLNGGTCDGLDHCDCQEEGWEGDDCSESQCGLGYCQNGGTCSGVNICTGCSDGWTGSDCGTSECDVGYCVNGVCDGVNSCDCGSSGFEGVRCNITSTGDGEEDNDDNDDDGSSTSSSSSNVGAIVGGTFGGISAVVLMGIMIFLCCGILLLCCVLVLVGCLVLVLGLVGGMGVTLGIIKGKGDEENMTDTSNQELRRTSGLKRASLRPDNIKRASTKASNFKHSRIQRSSQRRDQLKKMSIQNRKNHREEISAHPSAPQRNLPSRPRNNLPQRKFGGGRPVGRPGPPNVGRKPAPAKPPSRFGRSKVPPMKPAQRGWRKPASNYVTHHQPRRDFRSPGIVRNNNNFRGAPPPVAPNRRNRPPVTPRRGNRPAIPRRNY